MTHVRLPALAAALAPFLLCACSMIQMVDPDFKVPMPRLPKLKNIVGVIPGVGAEDRAASDDPQVAFDPRAPLGHGHTLRLVVYEGSRGAARVYRGVSMIDTQGHLPLSSVGTARVGGLTLPQAAEAIAATVRLAGQSPRPITVHILSVENTPVIAVLGDVSTPSFIPAFENVSVEQAVAHAGGRTPGSTRRGVYITREGNRRFFSSAASAQAAWKLRAGDIITLSPDI